MQIPIPEGENSSGFPTVSPNQLRIYGAGGFRLDEQEAERGCPRQYKARYVEKRVPEETGSYPLEYGSFFHDVMFRMEEDGLTPDEALDACFPAHMEPEAYVEARDDLVAYMERGASPSDRYATLSVENELDALLYVDEEYGPIHMRGFIDWLGVDLDEPTTAHVVDYKTNRFPPREEDVRGDVQLKTYQWLVMQNADRWGIRRVVVHLDAVKWRSIEVAFTDEEIEDWHAWCVAVVRKILRDEDAAPRLNPGCAHCPVRDDCPIYVDLPETAKALADNVRTLTDPEARLAWRDAANKVRLLLEKSVKSIDAEFQEKGQQTGGLTIGTQHWETEITWGTSIDLLALHEALGNEFYDVVSTSETRLKNLTKNRSPSFTAEVMATVTREPTGSTVKRKTIKE